MPSDTSRLKFDTLVSIHAPLGPVCCLEMIVEPPEQDLVRRQLEQVVQGFAVFEQAVQLGVVLQVNLAQQTAADNLPDETKNKVFTAIGKVLRADVDYTAANRFRRSDHNVIVFRHLERVWSLSALSNVEYTLINSIRHGVVDQLAQKQAVTALVKKLERVRRNRKAVANMSIARETRVDVMGELGALVLIDRVLHRRVAALNGHATLVDHTGLGITSTTQARDELLA